jgi:hypothetical protein
MKMTFAGYGSPLVLMLEELGVVTDCSIRTMEPDEPVEIDIRVGEHTFARRTHPPTVSHSCVLLVRTCVVDLLQAMAQPSSGSK